MRAVVLVALYTISGVVLVINGLVSDHVSSLVLGSLALILGRLEMADPS